MDPVEEIENQISDLLMQQRRRNISRLVYWEIHDEIQTLDAKAREITAQQREEPQS